MIRALVLLLICLAGPSGAAPSCTADPAFGALDASRALTDLGPRGGTPARQALQDLGVSTLIRYYDHVDETLPCKTLMPEETAALLDAGFSLLAVFQSNGDDPLTFLTPGRGAADANRAIDLALMNGQPAGVGDLLRGRWSGRSVALGKLRMDQVGWTGDFPDPSADPAGQHGAGIFREARTIL